MFRLLVAYQCFTVVDARWQFVLEVGHHYQRFVATLAECLYHLFDTEAVWLVKTVQRLVKDEELGVLNHSSCKEHKALFATRQLQKTLLGKMLYAKYAHPEEARIVVLGVGFDV